MVVCFTHWIRPKRAPEMGYGKKITESAGYIPAKIQIEDMINAGMRLNAFREDQFDFGNKDIVPDDALDPTRSPGFDMADAAQMKLDICARKKEREESEKENNSGNEIANDSKDANVDVGGSVEGQESEKSVELLSGQGEDKKGDKKA